MAEQQRRSCQTLDSFHIHVQQNRFLFTEMRKKNCMNKYHNKLRIYYYYSVTANESDFLFPPKQSPFAFVEWIWGLSAYLFSQWMYVMKRENNCFFILSQAHERTQIRSRKFASAKMKSWTFFVIEMTNKKKCSQSHSTRYWNSMCRVYVSYVRKLRMLRAIDLGRVVLFHLDAS